MGRLIAVERDMTPAERLERLWGHIIDSFRTNAGVWMPAFDAFLVARHEPEVRDALANGLEDGRLLWANVLDEEAPEDARVLQEEDRAVGSLFQALISGVLVQWLIDPDRAPSAADLMRALLAVTSRIANDEV